MGLATFVLGIALLGMTFKFAFELFTMPVESSLGLEKGKPMDVSETGRLGMALLVRVVMLLLMCVIASLIANRGVKMYSSRVDGLLEPKSEPKPPASSEASAEG